MNRRRGHSLQHHHIEDQDVLLATICIIIAENELERDQIHEGKSQRSACLRRRLWNWNRLWHYISIILKVCNQIKYGGKSGFTFQRTSLMHTVEGYGREQPRR